MGPSQRGKGGTTDGKRPAECNKRQSRYYQRADILSSAVYKPFPILAELL